MAHLMARVTIEDCIDKVEGQYELVLLAKERAVQLNSGVEPNLDRENDRNTVIALREIAEEKISVKEIEDSGIYKLRKNVEQNEEKLEDEEMTGDDFENLYKGEVSKSGVPILPSKRARKIPEKTQVKTEKEILVEDSNATDQISLDELKEKEDLEDTADTNNSENS